MNSSIKKAAKKAVIIIASIITLPFLCHSFDKLSPYLAGYCKTVGRFCAELSFLSPDTPDRLFSHEIQSSSSVFTQLITFPMNEYLPDKNTLHIGSGSAWSIDMAPDEIETPAEIPPLPTPSEEILNAIPYPDNIEDNDGDIVTVHYGTYDSASYITLENGGQVRNCTDTPNEVLIKASQEGLPFEVDTKSSLPQVLIYHTHTTESFEPYTRDFFDKDFTTKTTDTSKNMVAVGNAICSELESAGIAVLHDTTVHDYPSYNGSYQSSRETVKDILEKYPSIKVVLDIHRDGIEKADGTRLSPIAEIDNRRAAQIMIISCCDDGSGNIPDYMDNFKFACALQSRIESDWEGLTRPVLFDYRFYNQDLSVGSLLIEVGSHGNSLDEAVYSGKLIGKSLVNLFSD